MIRVADLTGPDSCAVARLVEGRLTQTEREEALHLGDSAEAPGLPARYRSAVDEPAGACADSVAYVAELDSTG